MSGGVGSRRVELRVRTVIAVVGAVAVLVMQPAGIAGAGSTDSAPDDASARPPVLVVGHRGASADAPEHTGPAYDRAMWAGGDVLECDVQITADDQLVCIHDGSVDRTTGGSVTGPVDSFTLAELRSMDFGAWFGPEFAGARVVTLEEQITCYRSADPTMQFYVETKTQPEQGDRMESLLVELLGKLDAIPDGAPDVRTSPVIIQSFDADSLTTVRRLAPSLPTAFLFNAPTAEIEAGQFPDVEILAPNAVALADRPGFIDAAHSGGIEVHTWTVDDPAQMTRLVNAGVDGFFTNTPSTARTVVDQAGRGSGREPLDVDRATSGPSEVSACPTGMGVGLTPATQEVSAANDTDDATAPIGPTANDGFPIWPIVLGAVALVVVIGVLVAIRARRSGATDH